MIALWMGLSCSDPPEPVRRAPHAAGWDALVAAVERGDIDTARIHARDVTLGEAMPDHEAAGRLGAALGFLQLAEPGDDLSQAIARARAACEDCHADTAVSVKIR